MFPCPRRIARGAAAATIAALLASPLFAVSASAVGAPPIADPAVRGTEAPQPTDRFIVKFRDSAHASSKARGNAYGAKAKELGITVTELKVIGTGATVVETSRELEAGESEAFVGSLEADTAVEYAEPDQIMQATSLSPEDELYGLQWPIFGENGIDASAAWDTTTGEGITVAVVDTGITRHTDLDANVLPGYDMIGDPVEGRDGDGRDADATDEGDYGASGQCGTAPSSWHGTHVAGTIAAAANTEGVVGIAPGAKILPVRALAECGGWMSDIMDGVIWASGGAVPGVPGNPNPAQVINLSIGGSGGCSTSWQSAINGAASRGSVVVVAAGNEGKNAVLTNPANCANVIAVAATGQDGGKAAYSNYGDVVDVAAPGGNMDVDAFGGILSTINMGSSGPVEDYSGQAYAFYQGTSMAAPHVAATAALMLSANRALGPAAVEGILKGTAKPLPIPCEGCGTGLINARAAVDAALAGEVPTAPEPGGVIVPGGVSITGNPVVGGTLTVEVGTWEPSPVDVALQWYRNSTLIPGATGTSYTLQPEDANQSVHVLASGTKPGFVDVTKESLHESIQPGALTSVAPRVGSTGEHVVGTTLTVIPGTWQPAPVAIRYQWYRGAEAIPNATGASYTLSTADIGFSVRASVMGEKAGYLPATLGTDPTNPVRVGGITAGTPTITGTTRVGQTLSANPGTWTPAPDTLTYQWFRSGVPITGANGATFALTAADLGKSVSVGVTGSKAGYTSVLKYSAWSGTVLAGSLTATKPTVIGTTKVGHTLTANTGTWTAGTTFTYQWFRTGVPITGATGKTYALTAADLGKNISVGVTGSKPGYTSVLSYSLRTGAVVAGTLSAPKPTVSGTTRINYTLTANTGTWTGGATLRYQWFRTGVPIPGATGKTYRLASADLGKNMSVGVYGSKAGYTNATVYSVRTAAVTR